MTNEELVDKFARNTEGVLSPRAVDLAAKEIWDLGCTKNVRDLMQVLRRRQHRAHPPTRGPKAQRGCYVRTAAGPSHGTSCKGRARR